MDKNLFENEILTDKDNLHQMIQRFLKKRNMNSI